MRGCGQALGTWHVRTCLHSHSALLTKLTLKPFIPGTHQRSRSTETSSPSSLLLLAATPSGGVWSTSQPYLCGV